MSNSYKENDPRLRQDKFERKDRENTSAGMIAGVIILVIGIVGIYLYYTYYRVVTTTPALVPATLAQPETVTTTNTVAPANIKTNTAPVNNQNTAAPTTTAPVNNQNTAAPTTPGSVNTQGNTAPTTTAPETNQGTAPATINY